MNKLPSLNYEWAYIEAKTDKISSIFISYTPESPVLGLDRKIRNGTENLQLSLQAISEIKGVSKDIVMKQIEENIRKLYPGSSGSLFFAPWSVGRSWVASFIGCGGCPDRKFGDDDFYRWRFSLLPLSGVGRNFNMVVGRRRCLKGGADR